LSKVRDVLRTSPFLMEFYLHEVVFPQLLRHADSKLSASGQDLGGEMLCGSRLGYSGTPNDLLPRALGGCVYASGDDTKMLNTLSDPTVVEVFPIAELWSAQSLLKVVAAEQPPLSALIDVGALITGLSNIEVAQSLLDYGLPHDAVVFCDHGGEQQVLRRGRREAVKLAHCMFPPERRFVFYDQIHTTGIDIPHARTARAALTIGKDSTFRDYAQGAYRMRGVGRGQRLKVLLTPEVLTRVHLEVPEPDMDTVSVASADGAPARSRSNTGDEDLVAESAGRRISEVVVGADVEDTGLEFAGTPPGDLKVKNVVSGSWAQRMGLRRGDQLLGIGGVDLSSLNPDSFKQAMRQRPLRLRLAGIGGAILDRVCAWLLSRQAAGEHTQQHLLRRQAIEHEARRCAFHVLEKKFYMRKDAIASLPRFATQSQKETMPTSPANDARLEWAIDLFCECVSYNVDTTPYGLSADSGPGVLQSYVSKSEKWLDDEALEAIQELAAPKALCSDREADYIEQEQRIFAEMEQEHELELFAEQEQEKEQEQEEEMEEEEDQETSDDVSASSYWQALKREEAHEPWSLNILARAPPEQDRSPFYPASQFELASPSGQCNLTTPFPDGMWVSRNFQGAGRGRLLRRLRTPTVVLEWIPDRNNLHVPRQTRDVSPQLKAQLRLTLDILGIIKPSDLTLESVRALLHALGADVGGDEVDFVHKAIMALQEAKQNAGGDVLLDVIAEGLQHANALELPHGRCYALLTLAEAELIRIALHTQISKPWFLEEWPDCCVALRLLRSDPLELSVLDTSNNWSESPFRWHGRAVAQCLRFLAAEMQYSGKEVQSLRHLFRRGTPWQTSPPMTTELLRDFFLASYVVRRRPQPAMWMDQPVARLFASEEDHRRMQQDVVLREAYIRLAEAGLQPSDVFRLLDVDGDGELQPRDFGTRGSDLGLPPELVVRLFQAVDEGGHNVISARDWMTAFSFGEGEQPSAADEVNSSEHMRPPENVSLDTLRRVSIELVAHTAFVSVWTSEGTQSRRRTSIWAADQLVHGIIRVTALRLSIGDYANQGFADVRGGGGGGINRRLMLQVKDNRWSGSSSGATSEDILRAVADHYCPHPVKYRHVWSQRRGTPLFIWRPVPPSDAFVALGMIATTENTPPKLDAVRCVPKSFCRPAVDPPVFLWDDTGSGGKPASFWIGGSNLAAQALWVTQGHAAPHDTFWELAAESITFDYTGKPSVHVRHETGGSPKSGGVMRRQTSR